MIPVSRLVLFFVAALFFCLSFGHFLCGSEQFCPVMYAIYGICVMMVDQALYQSDFVINLVYEDDELEGSGEETEI